jgi:hypothetical protein
MKDLPFCFLVIALLIASLLWSTTLIIISLLSGNGCLFWGMKLLVPTNWYSNDYE